MEIHPSRAKQIIRATGQKFVGKWIPRYNLCDQCRRVIKAFREQEVWLDYNYGRPEKLLSRPRCQLCTLIAKHIGNDVAAIQKKYGVEGIPILTLGLEESRGHFSAFGEDLKYSNSYAIQIKVAGLSWGFVRNISDSNLPGIRRIRAAIAKGALPKDPRFNSPDQISPQLIRHWLSTCEKTHNCRHDMSVTRLHPAGKNMSLDIFLIDVARSRLVSGQTSWRYCALSYVWGNVPIFKTTRARLQEFNRAGAFDMNSVELPQVVRDAMILVNSLGERYLWVDSICIVQDDANQKHNSIMQMNLIYNNALLTIASLSGVTANESLPGVRAGTRFTQSTASISGMDIFISGPSLTNALRTSEYETRGWTFQERVLSKRCLYFSKHQIYFTCGLGTWSESDPLGDSTGAPVFPQTEAGIYPQDYVLDYLNPLSYVLPGNLCAEDRRDNTLIAYKRLVSVYTKRHLSYSSDILNAFSGILAALEQPWNTRFIYGIPDAHFGNALLWKGTDGSITRRGQDRRGHQFPSWSWVGWIGSVEFVVEELKCQLQIAEIVTNSYRRSIAVRDIGEEADFQTLPTCKPSLVAADSPEAHEVIALHILAFTVPAAIIWTKISLPQYERDRLFAITDWTGYLAVLISASKKPTSSSRKISFFSDYTKNNIGHVMLIKEEGDISTRITIGSIKLKDWEGEDPTLQRILLQ
ncbi:uncharacterized protein BP5553_00237 [Venustampulla echinocandica]|uniref:Heterokaryon incompatibility domain-containing protein n=1 Tax=Venustampulla echinocandica TaxID=2656787 RepID=A0A370TXN2_9HELO|nr:uncharacterized protein BP5553_00237 [Venustampulla echinocandica]RDL40258.1 hypothetical protein BP5553_00237 [Venustampulla echinocandica]